MKCPQKPFRPRVWAALDDDEEPYMYIIRNPLRGGAPFVGVPSDYANLGFMSIVFVSEIPQGAVRVTCPLQNDEAYDFVASAVTASAVSMGFSPDTRGPLFAGGPKDMEGGE